MSHRHHGLADDLFAAREKSPTDPHLRDAVIAFLSRALPLCRDPDHLLCQRVRSAHTEPRTREDNE